MNDYVKNNLFDSINDYYLIIKEVIKITGIKRSTLYNEISRGNFPAPIKLTMRTARWRKEDICNWFKSKGIKVNEQ